MKTGTPAKLKFKKLQRRLGLSLWQCVGLLETLWQVTVQNAPDGAIGSKMTDEDIAVSLEWDGDGSELVAALVETEWLDTDPEFRLIVHDWSEHVPNFLKGSFAKHGKLFADQIVKQRDPSREAAAKHGTKQAAKQAAWHGATKSSQVKPSQTKGRETAAGAAGSLPRREKLMELTRAWNSLPRKRVVFQHSTEDPLPQAVVKGWSKVQRHPEPREAFEDVPRLVEAIRRAKFCHGQGWFKLPWLFATNDKGEWNVQNVLDGSHDDGRDRNGENGSHNKARAHDPEYDPGE